MRPQQVRRSPIREPADSQSLETVDLKRQIYNELTQISSMWSRPGDVLTVPCPASPHRTKTDVRVESSVAPLVITERATETTRATAPESTRKMLASRSHQSHQSQQAMRPGVGPSTGNTAKTCAALYPPCFHRSLRLQARKHRHPEPQDHRGDPWQYRGGPGNPCRHLRLRAVGISASRCRADGADTRGHRRATSTYRQRILASLPEPSDFPSSPWAPQPGISIRHNTSSW